MRTVLFVRCDLTLVVTIFNGVIRQNANKYIQKRLITDTNRLLIHAFHRVMIDLKNVNEAF